uniref:4-hydroxyphenylpyruvate dioxygenase n=1 Tax=Plectus sambesii TaxID=2011161 RepID=A0A914UNT5_9BILA
MVQQFVGFDHVRLIVSNAKQAAEWYEFNFGFEIFAYRGLETGSRLTAAYAVRQSEIVFVFETALTPGNQQIGGHLIQHGDSVKDVAFRVEDVEGIVEAVRRNGGKVVRDVSEETDHEGTVRFATVQTYGNVVHTLIQRDQYTGTFLPGFLPLCKKTPTAFSILPSVRLSRIDHVVGNQPALQLQTITEWYEKMLGFQRFWSIDDSVCHSDYSAMKANLITNDSHSIMMTICEPALSSRRGVSQIQEFVNFNGGAGVQHIALKVDNIIDVITALKRRGLEFLQVPDSYYDDLEARLKLSRIQIVEEMSQLRKLNILVDFDDHGYLLQIFTKPVQDRPTLFLELIQRENFNGFGAGNFKALFEAIEREQVRRGTLESE